MPAETDRSDVQGSAAEGVVAFGTVGLVGSGTPVALGRVGRLSVEEEQLRGDAMLAWLSSREFGSQGVSNEASDIGDEQNCLSYNEVVDNSFDALDVAFAGVARDMT